MVPIDRFGIIRFLKDYSGMSILPSRLGSISIEGTFSFEANAKGHPAIVDSYELRIEVPTIFPKSVPKVVEVGNRIPRISDYHIYKDGEICLGSPIRLLFIVNNSPSLVKFAQKCIVPYLYAVSIKLKHGGEFVFSELAHGGGGVIDDYKRLFNLQHRDQVLDTLNLIAAKKRLANKKPCPCFCGVRLGKCSFNQKIRAYRFMAPRSWFKAQAFFLSRK